MEDTPKVYIANIMEPVALTKTQLSALLKMTSGSEIYIPIILAALCGLRRSEVLGLKWDSVDLAEDKGCINVREQLVPTSKGTMSTTPKTKTSTRKIPIGPMVVNILHSQNELQSEMKKNLDKEYSDQGYVVCNTDGSAVSPTTLNKRIKRALRQCELPDIRFHDLRHTFSSIMANEGVIGKVRATMMGHAEEDITDKVYTHVYDEAMEKAAQIMDNVLEHEL